jgi:hypothetical protein
VHPQAATQSPKVAEIRSLRYEPQSAQRAVPGHGDFYDVADSG